MKRRTLRAARNLALCAVVVLLAQLVPGLIGGVLPAGADTPEGIALSPSVVMLSGKPGQAHRQMLQLANHTTATLSFELIAQDVVADGERRVFHDAGEQGDSIAATAVFSPKEIVIAPGAVGTASVTLTVPAQTSVREVAAIFRGRTAVNLQGGLAMTAALGCLITFTLSDDFKIAASDLEITPQSATSSLGIALWVTNTAAEPVVPQGAVALINDAGSLTGRVPIEAQRLLPGERLKFTAEYPTLLEPGSYQAVSSLEYEQRVLTKHARFTIPSSAGDRRHDDRPRDVQQ
jgi:hypothetical protein